MVPTFQWVDGDLRIIGGHRPCYARQFKVAGAHTIVENMRHGMSPLDAGVDALKRIARNYNRNYNNDMNKLKSST
jgi:hypothetical protein